MKDPTQLIAGTHIELVAAEITGGVKMRDGKLIILGLVADVWNYHGSMQDLETLSAKNFKATVVIEGRIVREMVPEGQETLPFAEEGDSQETR